MELFKHVVYLSRCQYLSESQAVVVILTENFGNFMVEVALIEETLDAHLAHKAICWLHTQSDLSPASHLYRNDLHIFVRSIQVLDVLAFEDVHLRRGIC